MKLRRLKLDDVRANYKPLSEKQQAEIVGGFTQSEFLYMKNNGAWQGGEVDGMGYVTREGNVSLDGITVYGAYYRDSCPTCNIYDGHWRSGSYGPDESSGRADMPLFEFSWKSLMGGHSVQCGYY